MKTAQKLSAFEEAAQAVHAAYQALSLEDSATIIQSIIDRFDIFRKSDIFQINKPVSRYSMDMAFVHSELMKEESIYLIYGDGLVQGSSVFKLFDGRMLSAIESERRGSMNCFFTNESMDYLVCCNDYSLSYLGTADWVDAAAQHHQILKRDTRGC